MRQTPVSVALTAGLSYSGPMEPKSTDQAALAALLRWYVDAGVDWAVDEIPHDRFAEAADDELRARTPPPAPEPEQRTNPVAPTPKPAAGGAPEPLLSTDAAERTAREIAAAASDLESLRQAFEAFDGCGLKRTASRLVFSDGSPSARLMLIGEAPGAEEDRIGKPFVGRAGQLLDRMLAAIGLDRTKVYIANVVPWRPPGNRTPTPQETTICMPFLRRQIALVDPDLVVALGGASAQALFGLKEGIMRARGIWRRYEIDGAAGAKSVEALATLHPAYLLRSPGAKRLAWRDLREIRKALDRLP
jgi:uracil-DNA glycosylase